MLIADGPGRFGGQSEFSGVGTQTQTRSLNMFEHVGCLARSRWWRIVYEEEKMNRLQPRREDFVRHRFTSVSPILYAELTGCCGKALCRTVNGVPSDHGLQALRLLMKHYEPPEYQYWGEPEGP